MAKVVDTTVAGRAGRIPVRIYVPRRRRAALDRLPPRRRRRDRLDPQRGAGHPAARGADPVHGRVGRLSPRPRAPAPRRDRGRVRGVGRAGRRGSRAAARRCVAGDSFGGFLSAHVDRHARTAGRRRPDLQVLIYPIDRPDAGRRPSIDRLRRGLPADPLDGALVPRALPPRQRRPPRRLAARSGPTSRAPPRRSSSPPATIRSSTRGEPTRTGCAPPGSRSATAATRPWSMASSAWPGRSAPPAPRPTRSARTSSSTWRPPEPR